MSDTDAIERPAATWDALQAQILAWANRTFPGAGLVSSFTRLREELDEINAAPSDDLEWADALMIFLHRAKGYGVSMSSLLDAAAELAPWAQTQTEGEPLGATMAILEEWTRVIEEDPEDRERWHRAFAIYLQAAARAGKTEAHLLAGCQRKFEIVQKRSWLPPDANGVVRHAKGGK